MEGDLFGAPPPCLPAVPDHYPIAPLSVLDARQGEWQSRKRRWISLGLKSEEGRGGYLLFKGGKASGINYYRVKEGIEDTVKVIGTSIFDPVLCEGLYRWFCPAGGQIIDPFAGGSVRGVVAGKLGYKYWGSDLSAVQIIANNEQGDSLCNENKPTWICGDSAQTLDLAPPADFIISCPPYGNLEVYSDDPADLSNMSWVDFLVAYRLIIGKAIDHLKDNRFACFVVGDFRDRDGFYRDFAGATVKAFEAAGARFYNDAILVTMVASASMRITTQFEIGRKMARTHQNVLIFCKGDPALAAAACPAGP